ncbi:MAG TPA: dihydrodipicolinate reductase C-terminal domain-containing protein, partial [Candidatus Acidoferrales bacterium]|nr:dihydrodipicolinate reductase C-terminal domain-containing protein [Candidatus Acidoferrales bacterium]
SIMERHHVHKKDAPSGTAVSLQTILKNEGGQELEITSIREGETVGMHVVMLDSPADSILLTHDAKNRLGFAEGAVRAAEWIAGKKGFYEFRDVFEQL